MSAKNHMAALNAKEKEYRALLNMNHSKANAATRKKVKDIPERLKKIAAKKEELQQQNVVEQEEVAILAQLNALRASQKKPASVAKKPSQKMPVANRVKLLQERIAINANAEQNAKKRASMRGLKTKAMKELQKYRNEGALNNNKAL
jgi:hypothetical protein